MAAPPHPGGPTSGDAIAAMVEPIKAIAALAGFAIGAFATWESGADLSDTILHGLLGAALLFPIGWFLALVIVRESIKANVEDQRRAYDERVSAARKQVADQLQRQMDGR
jgi:hypothetical protein